MNAQLHDACNKVTSQPILTTPSISLRNSPAYIAPNKKSTKEPPQKTMASYESIPPLPPPLPPPHPKPNQNLLPKLTTSSRTQRPPTHLHLHLHLRHNQHPPAPPPGPLHLLLHPRTRRHERRLQRQRPPRPQRRLGRFPDASRGVRAHEAGSAEWRWRRGRRGRGRRRGRGAFGGYD